MPWEGDLSRRELLIGGAAMLAAAACGGDGSGGAEAGSSTTSTTSTADTTSTTEASGTTVSTGGEAAYYPPVGGDWETVDPASAGWKPAGIDAVIEYVGSTNGRTFTMLSGGRLLAEAYFAGTDASTVQDVASVQKVVTSTLIGIAAAHGQLGLEDTITSYLGAGWSRAAAADEATITVRHLLTMTSGLNPNTLKTKTAPGAAWDYNTAAYQRLRPVLEKATATDINTLSRDTIFDAIGISDVTVWRERGETDAMGVVQWGLAATARDMARFGLLAQRLGQWDGTEVVSEAWIREAWSSIPQKVDYGYLWWLLGKGHLARQGAPDDLVAGLGAQDQKIYVVPSLDVVVTRQGTAAKEASEHESDFDAQLLKRIGAARAR